MKNIFVSFSPRDNKHMMTMRENLMRLGHKPWIDPNPRPGLDWRFEIDDAIRTADAVIVIVTPAAAESVYVTYEWSLAIGLDIPVIPVVFQKAKMHPRLQMLEHFDTNSFTNEAQFWNYFTREINRILADVAQPSELMPAIKMPEPPAQQAGMAFTRQVMPTEPGHYIVVRRGPGLNAIFPMQKQLITLGRDEANDITIDDPEVSRFHLRIQWQADQNAYTVDDLKSTNGTRLNGGARLNSPQVLLPGTALMLGDTIIVSYELVS